MSTEFDSIDREARRLRVINLLMDGTRDGSLDWTESYGGYQTVLGGQTVVLDKRDSRLKASRSGLAYRAKPGAASLEVRGKKGEVLEHIQEADPVQIPRSSIGGRRSSGPSREVTDALEELYRFVDSHKEIIADAAMDNLLSALEDRVRAK